MDSALRAIDKRLQQLAFLTGFESATSLDRLLFAQLDSQNLDRYPALARWYRHLASYSDDELHRLPLAKNAEVAGLIKPLIGAMSPAAKKGPKAAPAPAPAPVPASNKENKPAPVADSESGLPQALLHLLAAEGSFNSIELAAKLSKPHTEVIGAVKSLLSRDNLVETKDISVVEFTLSKEGLEITQKGSHEYNVFVAVGPNGAPQPEVAKIPNAKVGISKAMANGWITMQKGEGGNKLVRKVENVEDEVRKSLEVIAAGKGASLDANTILQLKKRKLVAENKTNGVIVSKGSNFTTTLEKPELDLTAEMLSSGSWQSKSFKKYNFDALGVPPSSGHFHPLLKVRTEFRQIFLEMGFTEMPTNRYVESSFWNFDALFQPQQHPARDAHDTFFISDPEISTEFPKDYLERVKKVHSQGGYGSIGYEYDWKIEEAQKNVLRTHTTAVSARQLHLLAQSEFKPAKMFSIDRVFRNETLDATHLAEFHQVEGVVAERNLSLGHVIGLFTEFFRKCGIENLRFKPTYNPYTEPSMEIFAYHEGLGKWVEIGNSGLFRPEMLLPMGLPEDVNVAGFGLSLERPTMIRYGISNIRELFGPKVNIEMIYKNPICRLDKE